MRRYLDYVVFISLFLLCIILMVFSSKELLVKVKSGGFGVFSVGSKIFFETQSFFKENLNSIKELARIKQKNEELKKELEKSKKNLKSIEYLEKENEKLKRVLGFSQDLEYINIPAKIVGYSPDNIFDTIMINKGSEDGISIDEPVITYMNGKTVLFGKINEVSKHIAKVSPVFNNTYVSVKLLKNNYNGLLSSLKNSSNHVKVKIYNVDSLVNKKNFLNDRVLTSSFSSLYPEGIDIGYVENISENINKEIELNVKLYLNFFKTDYIYVIKKID